MKNLGKALAHLKRQIQEDAAYAKDQNLTAAEIVDGLDYSEMREIIGELYEAALADLAVRS